MVLFGTQRFEVAHAGRQRAYLLHIPETRQSASPLVVMLHGAGGSAQFAAEETGWSELANELGFVVAYPEGLAKRPDKPPKFFTNPQEWQDGSGRGHADDVDFLATVLDIVSQQQAIDPQRIFVTGFSNGAGMSFRLAAELPARVAALAPVAGHCWHSAPTSPKRIPTYFIFGDSDPLLPIAGGTAKTPWGTVTDRPSLKETVDRWVKLSGLTLGSNHCQIKLVPQHGHHWPGGLGKLGTRLGGPLSTEFNATREIWKFFMANVRSESVQ